jgi:hypothetical protein
MGYNSPEKGLSLPSSTPEKKGVVVQPQKDKLQDILMEVNDIVGEASPVKAGEQWSGGGQVAKTGGQSSTQTASWRDQAIANLPAPQIMQKQLEKHIHTEIKTLRKQASKITDLRKPGAAHHMNELQSKIHRLNALLASLFEVSVDVMKRIFVRVFVDKQTVL